MSSNKTKQIVGISEMKFLLILGVVLIHCDISNEYKTIVMESTNIGVEICHYISSVLCSICVPCFFIISGYLFFKDVDRFSFSIYKKKLKSRVVTLVIPYFLWCTFCCLLLFIKSRFLGFSGLDIFLDNGQIDWINFIKGYFFIEESEGFPYAFAFWFIRNLILFVIISPVARIISQSNILLAVFYIAYMFGDVYYYGFEWFVLGATLVRFKRNNLPINKYNLLVATVIFGSICIARIWLENEQYMFIFQVISGFYIMYCLAIVLQRGLKRSQLFNYLVISTFSIYATHQCYCSQVRKLWVNVFGDSSFVQPIIAYILSFITLVFLGVIFNVIMNRYFPKILKIITGGR